MGSRYDIAVFRGVDLGRFAAAFAERGAIGAETAGPWGGPSGVAVAQIDTAFGSNVVVTAPPMRTPRGVDSLLATRLGSEALFATVWDTVSTYSLSVVGEGVDRDLSFEPPYDDGGEGSLSAGGDPLPEEPARSELDESYIQTVFERRCGIDPGNLHRYETVWRSLEPRREPEPDDLLADEPDELDGEDEREAPAAPSAAPEPASAAEPTPASGTTSNPEPGLWTRVKRLLGGGSSQG